MSKNTIFNNGDHIDFEIIKQNREQALKEICEGNVGLEQLMNTCLDLNIETHASCGDSDPYISFIINEHNKKYLNNIIKVFCKLGYRSRKYYDLIILNNPYVKTLNIYINVRDMDTSSFFIFIDELIHKFKDINPEHEKGNVMLMDLTSKLEKLFDDTTIVINLSGRFSREFPYILRLGEINENNQQFAKDILSLTYYPANVNKKSYRIYLNSNQLIAIYNYLRNQKHSHIKK